MSKDYVLMKGNEAIAEAALRAGCRFYAGYPITPQSEILEYMSDHMEERGGIFIQGENEIASMSMLFGASAAGARVMSSSSGPGFDLKQEEISYLQSNCLPAVLVNAMRYGTGDGEITAGQDSYWVSTRGGGHGDSRQIVLAPASVNECAQLTYEAFDLAEKYRTVVEILSDGAISQMIEKCTLPEPKEHDINQYDEWTLQGRPLNGRHVKHNNYTNRIGHPAYTKMMREKYKAMFENEQRWEEVETKDAELVLVAYGISSRVCKSAVREARKNGMKIGLIRPISVWPYPRKAFEKMPDSVKGYVTVEMSISSQMGEDILLAMKHSKPLYGYLTAVNIPTTEGIVDFCKDVLAGKVEAMEVM
ncbi:MAG: 3-methyl-2-oxobutanoate dehydrogenase subunit beta [Acidaminococcus sp.]|jgi:2-oxoglutarate ferredoxin oxidoreductase subunit alpha|nr:3-methyl-2-oxobutanoate dehydrogenase subunit beta [Acidaminococcus sp.]MCI2100850.1 3-methyl-2-oxobutanoate dehydrogenase subunit beta [Acidaminococcus sp.]MCI2115213.1 3-methyl-2-oxobutanoate dehydrogenase subunit beta [Acidaminococcus sp.]MCI2116654.1 3-methyl-2-oxobutanoate dehydrogenase subunit beta [Acidaminococcus sp.]